MAFDKTTSAKERRAAITITLPGQTVRYSTYPFKRSDGVEFDGKLQGLSRLQRSAGGLLTPSVILPSMVLNLDNHKDPTDSTRVQDLLATEEWANAAVEVEVGSSDTAADYTSLFKGVVKFPGGITFNDDTVVVRVVDARSADSRFLPPNTYDKTTYPNMEDKSVNLLRPMVYGDWSSGISNGEKVPAYQIDSTVGTGGSFNWADHAVKDLELVHKRTGTGAWSSVAFSSEVNSAATFTLDVAYDPDTDEIAVNGKGATDDGTDTGTLIQEGGDAIDDLLQTWCSVASGNMDATAITNLNNELSAADYVRRWIGGADQINSNDLISQLLRDLFADMTIEAGKYTPKYRLPSLGTGLDTFYEADIKSDGKSKIFDVEEDPEEIYTNAAVGFYSWDPVDGKYKERTTAEDSDAITDKGARIERTLNMPWLYVASGAENRTDREVFAFRNIEIVDVDVDTAAIDKAPTDQFYIAYNKYDLGSGDGTPFQVREIGADVIGMQATLRAWNIFALIPGTWTADSATTWLLSTADERDENGYWTDDNGYADTSGTPGEDSDEYFWF